MKALFVRCATSFAVALVLYSGLLFPRTDDGQEVPHQAMKLNQRGLDRLHKKEYDQVIASFREALQIHPEYPDALDNLGQGPRRCWQGLGSDGGV